MGDNDRAVRVEGLAFHIPSSGVDAMLRGDGIEVHLSGLNVRLSESALNAILARFAPAGPGGTMQAKLSADGVKVDRRDGKRALHVGIAAHQIRLSLADGELRLESD